MKSIAIESLGAADAAGAAGANVGAAGAAGATGERRTFKDKVKAKAPGMKSLNGRVFLIVFLATVVIQALSFGGVMAFHGMESRRQMYEFLGADLDFIVKFLRGKPLDERNDLVAQLNRGYYSLSLEPATLIRPLCEDIKMHQTAAVVQDKVGSDVPVRAVMLGTGRHMQSALELPVDSTQKLLVAFADKSPPFSPPPVTTILAYLALVTLAVLPFAWYAVCIATRPLSRFKEAAKALSQNLNSPQMCAEEGPVEVRDAARAFNSMQRAIQKHIDERTQVLASISHDLKTPLTRLRLRLADGATNGQRSKLEADIDAMSALVQEGLDFAASAQLREQRAPLDINRLLEDMAESAADMGHKVEVSGRLANPYPCAPRAVERALQNLVDNALKYGGGACIRVRDEIDWIEIAVEDEGPGLSPELLQRAFDPFFRGEQSRNRGTGGTGLGLAIARNLIRAHGGDIVLENRAAGGLAARVVLPHATPRV
jgi:signal transduction histidine kinase